MDTCGNLKVTRVNFEGDQLQKKQLIAKKK